MTNNNDFIKFKCPKCEMEYTIGEVFYPEDILGSPKNIIRNDKGKILFIEGENPDLTEDWECEKCGCDFKIRLEVIPHVEYDKRYDFNDEYSININNTDKKILF